MRQQKRTNFLLYASLLILDRNLVNFFLFFFSLVLVPSVL